MATPVGALSIDLSLNSAAFTVRTPAQQKAGRGGGFTFNDNSVITIDARGADAGVDRKIRDAMERTQAATVTKVRDLVERGGRYSAAFGV